MSFTRPPSYVGINHNSINIEQRGRPTYSVATYTAGWPIATTRICTIILEINALSCYCELFRAVEINNYVKINLCPCVN